MSADSNKSDANKAGDERHNAKVVAPPVPFLVWIALLEAAIKNKGGNNRHNYDANGDGDQLKSNENGTGCA